MVLSEMTGSLWAALCKRSLARTRMELGLPPEEEKPIYMTGEAFKAFVDATGGRMPGVGQMG